MRGVSKIRLWMSMAAKRNIWIVAGTIMAMCYWPFAWAAAVYTETYSDGLAGWTNVGSVQLTTTNHALRERFAAQSIPVPETGSFVATNTSSAGAFTGDYVAAGVQLIGFSFMAKEVLPSSALVRWIGPTSSYFQSFSSYVVATGIWYKMAFSLANGAAGQWSGGAVEGYADALLDVRGLEIQVTRAGMGAQSYYIDDVFTDALPVGSPNAADGKQVAWSQLRSNVVYVVESAETAVGPWEFLDDFIATGRSQIWQDEASSNITRRVYRLLFIGNQP